MYVIVRNFVCNNVTKLIIGLDKLPTEAIHTAEYIHDIDCFSTPSMDHD